MPDTRIKDFSTEATFPAADDFIPLDGATNGTRKWKGSAIASLANPRAAMQGLVFDGTLQRVEATLASALGTGDFFIAGWIDVPASAPASSRCLLHVATARVEGTTGEFAVLWHASGDLRLFKRAVGGNYRISYYGGIITAYGGKRVAWSLSRSGSTMTLKINGVAWAPTFADDTAGSPPAWSDAFDGTLLTLGRQGDSYTLEGFFAGPFIYTRVPSTAEQLSIVNQGTPVSGSLLLAPEHAAAGAGPQWRDVSGNGSHLNLPTDGTTGAAWALLSGAHADFGETRIASGYALGRDAVVIPVGYRIARIWCSGNGTFSIGNAASGTEIVNAFTATPTTQPATLAGYVTTSRKLYLTLGTATSVSYTVHLERI
jgi:hypothetical protein